MRPTLRSAEDSQVASGNGAFGVSNGIATGFPLSG
jgi:hypothetical protein